MKFVNVLKKFNYFILFFVFSLNAKKADLVIFSFDRPLQLYALLESIEKYITGLERASIIYRASSIEFEKAYSVVEKDFSSFRFVKQGNNPNKDFKPLTLQCTFDSPSKHILFAVDDIIVKDYINLEECIALLDATNAYGFFFRLGKNLNWCYPVNKPQPNPSLQEINSRALSWNFSQGIYDWAYPHTVDMTIYRKRDIEKDFQVLQFFSPNTLEGQWHLRSGRIMRRKGLCFVESKIVNLPLNRVQTNYRNRHENYATPQELLNYFNIGLKIDINPLYQVNNKSAHMGYALTFIDRNP